MLTILHNYDAVILRGGIELPGVSLQFKTTKQAGFISRLIFSPVNKKI